MKKNLTLTLIIIALGIGTYFLTTSVKKTEEESQEGMMTQKEEVMEVMEATEAMEEEAMEENKAPEDAILFSLSEGSKSMYVAQKRFLQREDSEVVGTTEALEGEGWITPDGTKMYLSVEIDLAQLTTDNPNRDGDVIKMFDETLATIMFDETALLEPIVLGEVFANNALAVVSINGVEKAVEFSAEGIVSETDLTVTGNATILMSEFGIEPPSLAGVFTVDDELELQFDISAVAN